MLVAVIGGKLQGVEATYLSKKAGWDVLVIDRKQDVPASGFCDSFIQIDVTSKKDIERIPGDVHMVIPALEDDDALKSICQWSGNMGVPCAFDLTAYSVSSSKMKSNRLFSRTGIPTPESWPGCGFPVVAKPSRGSGSTGVRIFYDQDDLRRHIPAAMPSNEWIIEEFLSGPSYSLEVMGFPGQYRPLVVTDLVMDTNYDCKRVLAPTNLSAEFIREFEKTSVSIAEALELRGLMDVEMIVHKGVIKILEIDARLPSQTPTAVYWSTGLNIVQMLGELSLHGSIRSDNIKNPSRGIVYEHIKVSPNLLEVSGEHIMTGAGPLKILDDFFGADEAITSYRPGHDEWVATLIISGADKEDAWTRRCRVIKEIRGRFGLGACLDPGPDDGPTRSA